MISQHHVISAKSEHWFFFTFSIITNGYFTGRNQSHTPEVWEIHSHFFIYILKFYLSQLP